MTENTDTDTDTDTPGRNTKRAETGLYASQYSTFGAQLETSAKFATADGGIIDAESGEKISDENTAASIWSDPKPETDKYGKPTGDHYVRCEECGVEVLTALSDCASHREGCSE
jgi:hypothetical protein